MKCHRAIFTRDLTEADIPNALEVSFSELGTDYLAEKDFLETINSYSAFCKVVTYDRQFAGFAICQVFGPDKVDYMLRLPDSQERNDLLSKEKIGLFDSTAIRKDLRGLGLGTELSMACSAEFESRDVDLICAMAWKSIDGTINVEGILRKMGMTPKLEIPGYWNGMVDSPGGHDCPVCGRPCKCSAVLYYRETR
jgi:ribosomal protein S18 acetylase RimI-like enzyme